jgi:hypothetical protein
MTFELLVVSFDQQLIEIDACRLFKNTVKCQSTNHALNHENQNNTKNQQKLKQIVGKDELNGQKLL